MSLAVFILLLFVEKKLSIFAMSFSTSSQKFFELLLWPLMGTQLHFTTLFVSTHYGRGIYLHVVLLWLAWTVYPYVFCECLECEKFTLSGMLQSNARHREVCSVGSGRRMASIQIWNLGCPEMTSLWVYLIRLTPPLPLITWVTGLIPASCHPTSEF